MRRLPAPSMYGQAVWNAASTRRRLSLALQLAGVALLALAVTGAFAAETGDPSTLVAQADAAVAGAPVATSPAPAAVDTNAGVQVAGSHVFRAEADARVDEEQPDTNFGSSKQLRTNGGSEPDVESYLRFAVSGLSGTISRAALRVFAYSATVDGPAVYRVTTGWSESTLTWRNRPGSRGGPVADSAAIPSGTWVEFDVTGVVTKDGTYSFRLASRSEDGVDFHSRERSGYEPHLAITTGDGSSPPPPDDPPPSDTTPPTVPAGLQQTSAAESGVSLTWSPSTDDVGVAGYGVYVDGQRVASASTTAHTVGGLTCGRSYAVAVDAFDAAGNRSALSQQITARTAACPSGGSTFYVAPTGSDANAGTLDRPWKTIGKAMATLTAGQTAYVRAGTYEEALGGSCGTSYNVLTWSRSGSSGALITISGYPGEERQVVVKTKLRLTGSYLRLANLVVDRNRSYSSFDKACTGEPNVNVYGDDVELIALDVRNSNMSGIYLSGADRAKILRNWIHDNGAHAKLDHGIYYGSGTGGVIANNVIERNLAFGIQMYPRPSGQVITQNTIVASGKAGMVLEGANLVVVNNVSAWNVEQGIRTSGACSGCWADLNVLYGNSSDYYLPSPLTVHRTIRADPRFANRSAGDYRLQSGSPAQDAARGDHSRPQDFDGRSRPQGAAPDIGAFER